MTAETDDESAIRAVTAQWLAGEKARDIRALLEHVTDDAVFLMPGSRTVSGKPAIRALIETFFAAFTSEHTASIAEVRVEGDWAFSWGEEVTVLRPMAGGPPVRMEGVGPVLRRGPDRRWRFARGINNVAPRPFG